MIPLFSLKESYRNLNIKVKILFPNKRPGFYKKCSNILVNLLNIQFLINLVKSLAEKSKKSCTGREFPSRVLAIRTRCPAEGHIPFSLVYIFFFTCFSSLKQTLNRLSLFDVCEHTSFHAHSTPTLDTKAVEHINKYMHPLFNTYTHSPSQKA